jgi:hypothetical protein
MKRCKVAHHELVMPFKVNLDPAHGPNRTQNRCRDVRPNRIVEIYDYPVMKPCTHAFPPISCALPFGPPAATNRSNGRMRGRFPPLTYRAAAANADTSGLADEGGQPAGVALCAGRTRGAPSGAGRAGTTLSAEPLIPSRLTGRARGIPRSVTWSAIGRTWRLRPANLAGFPAGPEHASGSARPHPRG